MRIADFLKGPLPEDVLIEESARLGEPLVRLYVVGFKGRYVDPDGRAKDVLSKYRLLAGDGSVRPCIAGFDVVDGVWRGPPAPLVGRYVDVASSDALFAGVPERCRTGGARPALLDMIRIDRDFEAPRFLVRRAEGKVQVLDRKAGVVLKEFSEAKYSAKAAARALGASVHELIEAERWGEGAGVPREVLLRHLRPLAERAAKKFDARFMLSGAKGFHVLFTLERPVPAEWRPAIARKLAEWLGIEADQSAFDVARKLRVPGTVHTETGRRAVFVDPRTLEPVDPTWPRPIPYDAAKALAALGMPAKLLRPPSRPERSAPSLRPGRWVPYLEAVAAENPGLKADCRRRFSSIFGCACAVDGLDVQTCAGRLAAALGMGELPQKYAAAMEREFGSCAASLAAGGRPLISIKNALTLDRDEEKGGVWYSIKECLTHIPPLPGRPQPRRPRRAEPQEPAAEPAKAAEEAAEPAGRPEPPRGSAEACLSNPICGNRLKLCIWKRLKVSKEERKKALYEEIERRGELFQFCIKDAVEYAEREAAKEELNRFIKEHLPGP